MYKVDVEAVTKERKCKSAFHHIGFGSVQLG